MALGVAALGRLKQDRDFGAILGYMVTSCHKKQKTKMKRTLSPNKTHLCSKPGALSANPSTAKNPNQNLN
jgi:hypothetical protein